MRPWNRRRGGAERGPGQQQRGWQRQDQLPQQTPAAPQDSQTPATHGLEGYFRSFAEAAGAPTAICTCEACNEL